MSDALFLITGGGTGAKVAEALVHLCAAGLAPRRVHVLLVDADTVNGNLERALQTARAYQKVQRWPWAVETTTGNLFSKSKTYLQIFGTELNVTTLAETLDTTTDGGIATQATTDDLKLVLDLLYDADEQTASCDDGFRARPNLGCLVLADHLAETLPTHATPFLDALVRETAGGQTVPVVVAASIFGGTGASLLPVIRGAVEDALAARGDGDRAAKALAWGATMVLPHYQPARRLESVDPDRYLLDTANALQFYGMAQEVTDGTLFDAIYAIGSDRPSRNIVEPVLGQKAQANPAYVEEMVAALGAIHFAETLGQGRRGARVFQPDRGQAQLVWGDLPLGSDERIRTRAAYLLHLGAFFLRPGDPYRQDLSKGLAALLATASDPEIEAYPWFKDVLDPWAAEISPTYKGTPAGRRASALKDSTVLMEASVNALRTDAVEYFGRLLLWAASALRDGTDGRGVLHLVTFHSDGDYQLLLGEMSRKGLDVDAPAPGEASTDPTQDNALVRLLRTALAAEVAAHERTGTKGIVQGVFSLVDADGRVGLRITPEQVRDALANERLGDVADEYTRTATAVTI